MILLVAATERELAGAEGAAGLVCGIGPVEAAAATARALVDARPDAVVNVGIAGARRVRVTPPALVLGSEAVYCDIAGDADAVLPRVERTPADPDLLAAARRALPEAHVLPIGTSARVGGGTGCDVEAMEGFGVLRAAAIAGVPAVELRCVSNLTDELDRGLWRFDDAFAALAEAVPRLLAELAR